MLVVGALTMHLAKTLILFIVGMDCAIIVILSGPPPQQLATFTSLDFCHTSGVH